MNKVIKILCVILIGSIINLSLVTLSKSNNIKHAKLSYKPDNLEMHVKDSDLIVIAQVKDIKEEIKMEGISFRITKIKVDKLIKGSTNNDEILLLQTDCFEDPYVKKNEKVLLFLEKYNGKLTTYSNTYVCKGLYQGHYVVNQNKIENSLKNNSNISYNKHNDVNLFVQEILNVINKQ